MGKKIILLWILFLIFSFQFCYAENTKHPSNSSKRICLSLKMLEKNVRNRNITETANNLGGIGWIEGFIIDPENQDIIIFGRQTDTWPCLILDDFVVNIRNIWNKQPYPYCSLDPQPENIRQLNAISPENKGISSSVEKEMESFFNRFKETIGEQEIVVGGVPRKSHHANVMIDADYHMKKLSQGLVKLDGIPSIMDLALLDMKHSIEKQEPISSEISMSRFWFHIKKGDPIFTTDKNIILLKNCSVVVLTEKQLATADGKLFDSGGNNLNADKFAKCLSEKFQDIATLVLSYAKLENLFRLSALLKVMYIQDSLKHVNLDFSFYLKQYNYQYEYSMPPSLPGLVNGKKETISFKKGNYIYKHILFSMAAGGVSMEIPISPTQFKINQTQKLKKLHKKIINSRPNKTALYWKAGV